MPLLSNSIFYTRRYYKYHAPTGANSIDRLPIKMKAIQTIVITLVLSLGVVAQEISFGDKFAHDEVKKKTSAIYDNKDKTHFLLTKKSFGKKSTCGTEITAYSKEKAFNRIVSKSCTKRGRLATEFYFENEKPIFVYQVFEFYSEKAKPDSWKNFKGIASWESRYYFVNEVLKFHRHKGRKDISERETGKKRKSEASKILSFVKSKTSK